MPKFKVGDQVIGLPSSTKRYGTTIEGWLGRVIEVDARSIPHLLRVKKENYEYLVDETYFALYPEKLEKPYQAAYKKYNKACDLVEARYAKNKAKALIIARKGLKAAETILRKELKAIGRW